MSWIAFNYLGYGYQIKSDGTIHGYKFKYADVPRGFLKFDEPTTAAIRIWCANQGFAGLKLKDYLDQVLGPPK